MGTGDLAGTLGKNMELIRLGFCIFMIAAIIGCVLLILFSLRADRKTIRRIKTGRAKTKTTTEDKEPETDQKTGTLREDVHADHDLNSEEAVLRMRSSKDFQITKDICIIHTDELII